MLPERACALERLLARKRELSAILSTLEGRDRWGNPSAEELAEMGNEGSAASAERIALVTQIEAEVGKMRQENPALVARWAEAHVALLDSYIAHLPDSESTQRFVAGEERKLWLEVATGQRALVDENTYYVYRDPELYRSLFGFVPA